MTDREILLSIKNQDEWNEKVLLLKDLEESARLFFFDQEVRDHLDKIDEMCNKPDPNRRYAPPRKNYGKR